MDVIGEFRRADGLRMQGLSEERIGVWMGIGQWTVSRLLALRSLLPEVAVIFEGDGKASLAALTAIARHSPDAQRASLADLRKAVRTANGCLDRKAVEAVMQRHGRDLDRAPFPVQSCIGCTARTGAVGDFFGGCDGLGRCLKPACWSRKSNAVKAREARWAAKKDLPGNSAGGYKGKKK